VEVETDPEVAPMSDEAAAAGPDGIIELIMAELGMAALDMAALLVDMLILAAPLEGIAAVEDVAAECAVAAAGALMLAEADEAGMLILAAAEEAADAAGMLMLVTDEDAISLVIAEADVADAVALMALSIPLLNAAEADDIPETTDATCDDTMLAKLAIPVAVAAPALVAAAVEAPDVTLAQVLQEAVEGRVKTPLLAALPAGAWICPSLI